ncbi:MAG: nucleotidyltransferase family protein [Bacteroidota bacterium]
MVSAMILAAGESSRMGSPKALLKIGQKTFLQYIADVLVSARVLDIVVVLGADASEIQKNLGWFRGKILINEDWQKGQLSSILVGLRAVEQKDLHGILICPVDCPLITQHLIVKMLHQFWTRHKPIVVPVYKGRRGHPVLIGRAFLAELERAPIEIGVRAVLWNHPDDVLEYQTEDDGVLTNIDTPEDYQGKIVKRFSSS